MTVRKQTRIVPKYQNMINWMSSIINVISKVFASVFGKTQGDIYGQRFLELQKNLGVVLKTGKKTEHQTNQPPDLEEDLIIAGREQYEEYILSLNVAIHAENWLQKHKENLAKKSYDNLHKENAGAFGFDPRAEERIVLAVVKEHLDCIIGYFEEGFEGDYPINERFDVLFTDFILSTHFLLYADLFKHMYDVVDNMIEGKNKLEADMKEFILFYINKTIKYYLDK